jgi:hypothetical protein
MAKKIPHLHRYERVILGKNNYTVFRCNLPLCSHYLREELANGKRCLCNRCNQPMELDGKTMKLRLPHCHTCTKPKPKKRIENVEVNQNKDLHDRLAEIAAKIS